MVCCRWTMRLRDLNAQFSAFVAYCTSGCPCDGRWTSGRFYTVHHVVCRISFLLFLSSYLESTMLKQNERGDKETSRDFWTKLATGPCSMFALHYSIILTCDIKRNIIATLLTVLDSVDAVIGKMPSSV